MSYPKRPGNCPGELSGGILLHPVFPSHYIISEISEFGLPKFRNFGMYKNPEISEFRDLEIPELQSLLPPVDACGSSKTPLTSPLEWIHSSRKKLSYVNIAL